MNKLLTVLFVLFVGTFSLSYGLIPQASGDVVGDIQTLIRGDEKNFTEKYNEQAEAYTQTGGECTSGGLGAALHSGIMNWQTFYCYALFLVELIRDAAAIVAVAMIIYAGYLYATGVYSGNASKGNSALTKAIIGTIVLTFALTIVRVAMVAGGFGS